jgi:hypothetical protein
VWDAVNTGISDPLSNVTKAVSVNNRNCREFFLFQKLSPIIIGIENSKSREST